MEREYLRRPDVLGADPNAVPRSPAMQRALPSPLERFGDGELEGWSAMQFIETSSITIHADEVSGRCFIDVFSCLPFDAEIAAAVALEHFGGTPTLRVLQR
jgi:hypothetical protein